MSTPIARRLARMCQRLGKEYESGYFGAPLPAYDQEQADEQEARAAKALDAPGMLEAYGEMLGTIAGPEDPDLGADGGTDEAAGLEGDEIAAGPTAFDLPYRTELRARAYRAIVRRAGKGASGAAEANAGPSLSDLGDQQTAAEPFVRPSDYWIAARKIADAAAVSSGWQVVRRLPVVVLAQQIAEPMQVETLEGTMRGKPGDWLVIGAAGERYFVDGQIFAATYEALGKRAELAPAAGRVRKADDPGQPAEYQGIPLVIDRPRGYVQEGMSADGTAWRRCYLYDYGYIPGTQGGDGEGLDVYVGPDPAAPLAYWVLQTDGRGGFDEYKLFVGFASAEHACIAYGLHTPPDLLGGVATTTIGQLKALLGIEPGELIKRNHTEALMGSAKKDDMPAGPGAQPGGDDPMAGSGGADIVEIATERLNSIMDTIEAAGGVLAPEVRAEIAAAVALLETVAPDDDDDYEADPDDQMAAAGPGQPMPMTANEKRAGVRKLLVGRMQKMRLSPEAFIAHCFKQVRKAMAARNPLRKKMLIESLRKQVTYGAEVYGNESAFQASGSAVPEIPMYSEAFVDVHVAEAGTPADEAVRSGYAYDATYTPNDNSQQAYNAGSPNFVEKFAAIRAQLAKFAPASIAAAAVKAEPEAAPPPGKPKDPPAAPPAAPAAAAAKNKSNNEAETWPPEYVAALPDSAFLYVEPGGAQDAAGLTQPPELRHYPYKDKDGKVDVDHLRRAIAEIPNAGLADDVKAQLTQQAQALLDEQGDLAKSEDVRKRLLSDEGWPDDMADPRFLNAQPIPRRPLFGFDNLPDKATQLAGSQE